MWRINFHSNNNYGNPRNVNSLRQTMTVGAGDVDPADGKVHVRFVFAPVLQNPAHTAAEQPYYFIQLTNTTQGTILYTDFNRSAQPGVPWKTMNGGTPQEIDDPDWTLVDIAPGTPAINDGDSLELEFIAGGCRPNGHFGELYVDGLGVTIPGLNVSGTAPAQANADTDLTYTLTYTNGSANPATGVVITFTTPPNTTYQAITPPAGATCTTPAVGGTGTITCTLAGSIAAGTSDSFSITVHIAAGTTGTITAGTYSIRSDQEGSSTATRSRLWSAATGTPTARAVTGACSPRTIVPPRSRTAPPCRMTLRTRAPRSMALVRCRQVCWSARPPCAIPWTTAAATPTATAPAQ